MTGNRAPSIRLVPYDKVYLDRSWTWLNDPEIKQLTLTPDFTREEQLAFFDRLPTRDDYRIWGVSTEAGEPIGAAGIKHIAAGSGESWCYIGERAWWGRGISREILTLCEREARQLGLVRLSMVASAANHRSLRAYEKMGYERCGTSDGGVIRMSKELPRP